MPIDLSAHTFLPCLTRRVRLRPGDSPEGWLPNGCILERRFKLGSPGVAGEYRPQMRDGAGDHSTIYVERRPGTNEVEEWRIRGVKGPVAGAWEYLCELVGSRALDTSRGGSTGLANRS